MPCPSREHGQFCSFGSLERTDLGQGEQLVFHLVIFILFQQSHLSVPTDPQQAVPLLYHCTTEKDVKKKGYTHASGQENVINLLGGQQAGSVQQEAGSEDRSSAGRLLECVIYFWLSAARAEWTLKLLDECNRWAEDYVSNLFPFCFLFIFLPLFTQCILSYFPPITASTILYQQPCYSSALNSSLIFPKKPPAQPRSR